TDSLPSSKVSGNASIELKKVGDVKQQTKVPESPIVASIKLPSLSLEEIARKKMRISVHELFTERQVNIEKDNQKSTKASGKVSSESLNLPAIETPKINLVSSNAVVVKNSGDLVTILPPIEECSSTDYHKFVEPRVIKTIETKGHNNFGEKEHKNISVQSKNNKSYKYLDKTETSKNEIKEFDNVSNTIQNANEIETVNENDEKENMTNHLDESSDDECGDLPPSHKIMDIPNKYSKETNFCYDSTSTSRCSSSLSLSSACKIQITESSGLEKNCEPPQLENLSIQSNYESIQENESNITSDENLSVIFKPAIDLTKKEINSISSDEVTIPLKIEERHENIDNDLKKIGKSTRSSKHGRIIINSKHASLMGDPETKTDLVVDNFSDDVRFFTSKKPDLSPPSSSPKKKLEYPSDSSSDNFDELEDPKYNKLLQSVSLSNKEYFQLQDDISISSMPPNPDVKGKENLSKKNSTIGLGPVDEISDGSN
ncbi:hypothetical protein HK096_010137, partial [Nowakowskiella sp. JEL0078]